MHAAEVFAGDTDMLDFFHQPAPRGESNAITPGHDMASEFAAYVLSSGAASPAHRRKPSHLMPPTEVKTECADWAIEKARVWRSIKINSLWLDRHEALMSTTLQVVAAQLDALQRNDWPEADAGVRAAFAFSKPAGAEELLPGQVRCTIPLNDCQ